MPLLSLLGPQGAEKGYEAQKLAKEHACRLKSRMGEGKQLPSICSPCHCDILQGHCNFSSLFSSSMKGECCDTAVTQDYRERLLPGALLSQY